MTDQHPQLPPEREAEIQRLLEDARATEPMPADVAERLDGVVADLDRERGPAPAPPATSLEARRRRRTVGSLVLAAAVVVVAGVGVGQVLRDSGGSDDAADSGSVTSLERGAEGEAEGRAQRGAEAPANELDQQAPPPQAAEDQAESLLSKGAPPRSLPIARVSREGFTADARRLRGALTKTSVGGFRELDTSSLPTRLLARRSRLACAAAPWGAGALVPAVFEKQAAVLAFRPPTGDTQVVHVLQCGSGETLHSTTLRAR